jgi:type III restriction enzyme
MTVEAARTVFNLTPVDNKLERRFAEFLDRTEDVAAFAKLTMNSRFSLEYISRSGALRYYYPDFVVRLTDDTCLVLETKGMEDIDVALKDRRARKWCRDASGLSGRTWAYYKVPQTAFEQFTGESVESLCRYLDAREGRGNTLEDA